MNNLPYATFDMSSGSVCDACACAKAHQLLYSLSSSRSSAPLQLVFQMFGVLLLTLLVKKNYVSFIDDYSIFTWI
jgi:hypothetical protein